MVVIYVYLHVCVCFCVRGDGVCLFTWISWHRPLPPRALLLCLLPVSLG